MEIEDRKDVPVSYGDEKRKLADWLNQVRLLDPKILNVKDKDGNWYLNIPCSFDIETTSYININGMKRACMYCYVFGVYGRVFVGRTWEQYQEMLELTKSVLGVSLSNRMVIYIHNLAYEFQFIRKRNLWHEVFAVSDRQPARALTEDGIEYRCSYLLSGRSLAGVGKNLTKHHITKMVGDLDYHKARSYKTPLTAKEWGYVFRDGLVVMAYIDEEIERNGGRITRIPLTKTGYVRRYMRSRCLYGGKGHHEKSHRYGDYMAMMKAMTLTDEEYRMAHQAFHGGFTHANAFGSGHTFRNVASFDFTSSYPAVMIMEKYPMGRGRKVKPKDETQFRMFIRSHCCIFYVMFTDIETRYLGDNMISSSKLLDADWDTLVEDNGRVVRCRYIKMCVTDVDFRVYERFYDYKTVTVGTMWVYNRDYLPTEYVKGVVELYKQKTTLKGVRGQEKNYAIMKENLNSTFGMTVTDICRSEYRYNSGDEWEVESCDRAKALKEYNESPTRFLSYLWGIFVTSYAMANLASAIEAIGPEDYLYSDTDSVKIRHWRKHRAYFDSYNADCVSRLKRACDYHGISYEDVMPKTNEGKVKVIGQWDFEGVYDRFKTLGAKRYIYEDRDGLHITIAGVSKSCGTDWLMSEYRTMDSVFRHFTPYITFPAYYKDRDGKEQEGSGKKLYAYIDYDTDDTMTDYLGVTAEVKELSSVYMESCDYEMGISQDYADYLKGVIYEKR